MTLTNDEKNFLEETAKLIYKTDEKEENIEKKHLETILVNIVKSKGKGVRMGHHYNCQLFENFHFYYEDISFRLEYTYSTKLFNFSLYLGGTIITSKDIYLKPIFLEMRKVLFSQTDEGKTLAKLAKISEKQLEKTNKKSWIKMFFLIILKLFSKSDEKEIRKIGC